MKHLYKIFFTGLLLAGCAKEEVRPEGSQGNDVAFASDIIDSRISYSQETAAVRLKWMKGDEIGIFSECSGTPYATNVKYLANDFDFRSSFTFASPTQRIKWKNDTDTHDFYAYYPYNESTGNDLTAVGVDVPSVQIQSGANNMDHISDSHFMWAAVGNAVQSEEPVAFTFNHLFTVIDLELFTSEKTIVEKVVFRIKGKDDAALGFTGGSVDLTSGNLDLSTAQTSSSVSVECNFTSSPGSSKHIYALVNPGHAGELMQICLVIKGKEKVVCEKYVPDGGFLPGQYVCTTVSYAPTADETVEIIDLSAVETSNCYLVTRPATAYKFKATVKGNGHIPSELNTVVTTTDINPGSVLVLWYNTCQTSSDWVDVCPIDMGSLTVVGGYVHFDTPEVFHNGNVVIAAFAEEGVTYENITIDENRLISNATLLWSWNIWAAENYDIDTDAFQAGSYTIMGRNIGAAVGKAEIESCTIPEQRRYLAVSAIGNYYQWGNKNPYPHISDYDGLKIPNYGSKMYATPTYTPVVALQESVNGSAIIADQMFGTPDHFILDVGEYLSDADRTHANIVACTDKAPYKYMKNTKSNYGYSWTGNIGGTPLVSLWGDPTLDNPSDHTKTIYDPCPPGWKVWSEDAWKAMAEAGEATATPEYNALDAADKNKGYGFMVCGSYFPTAGRSRSTDFALDGFYLSGTNNVLTYYTVSNPSIYSSGYWGRKYEICNYFETDDEGTTVNTVKITINGNFICVGYSTPLRCIKTK